MCWCCLLRPMIASTPPVDLLWRRSLRNSRQPSIEQYRPQTRPSATQGNQANSPIIRAIVPAASELILRGRLMYAMGDGAMGDGTGSDARRGEFAIVVVVFSGCTVGFVAVVK